MNKSPLAAKLKQTRRQHQMTQETLAKRLNINHKTYANYEGGVAEPSIETLKKLAALYHISLDELLSAEGSATFSGEDVELLTLIKGNPTMATLFRDMNKMTPTELATVMKMLSSLTDEK